jgi:hypothetical protein
MFFVCIRIMNDITNGENNMGVELEYFYSLHQKTKFYNFTQS